MIRFILLTVFIMKPIYIKGPDLVSKQADLREYYYKVGNCWVWKPSYNKNPRFYYHFAKRCFE